MIVISIGTERKVFSQNPTRERVLSAQVGFERCHLIVFSLKKNNFKKESIDNTILYPTNSSLKILYIWDAIRIAYKIIMSISRHEKNNTVVTVQDPFECGLAGLFISRVCNISFQVQIHTDIFSPFFKNTWMQHFRMLIAPWVIRSADAIRCDSKRMAEVIVKKQMSKAPIVVLPIFIDVKKYDLAQPAQQDIHDLFQEKRFVILMASRLEPEKEIFMAIDVFAKVILKHSKQIGLVIVGSGSLEQQLKDQVKKIGLEHDVLFVPWTDDLQSLYKTADLFLMTSRFEGYGLTIAESLLCGTPVLTSDVGVAPEVVIPGKTGWICPAQNHACFEQKLDMLVASGELYQVTKNYLTQNPYVHAYTDREVYQKMFMENIASASIHRKSV